MNPSEEDPRDHIRFEMDLPVAQTERGRHTIEKLGLRRSPLTEQRLQRINVVDLNFKIIELVEAMPSPVNDAFLNDVSEARKFIDKAVQPDAAFSSMAVDFVSDRGS